MEREIHDFIGYLHETKKSSSNTEISYERDLRKMEKSVYAADVAV